MSLVRQFVTWDATISQKLRVAEKPGLLRSLAILFAHSGDSWLWLIGLALLWWGGGDFWREKAPIYLGSILITAVLVMAIKFTVRRRRPEGEWGSIYRNTDPHSFPSGHAVRAILLAVLAVALGPGWFGAALWIWAPLVVLARVAMGLHFLSDVLAGAVLGLVVGGVITILLPTLPL